MAWAGLLVAIVAAVAAVAAVVVAWPPRTTAARERLAVQFRESYRYLQQQQGMISCKSLYAADPDVRSDDLGLLVKPGWIFSKPLPLSSLALSMRDEPEPSVGELVEKARIHLAELFPGPGGYAENLLEHAGVESLFDGVIYRLVEAWVEGGSRRLTFSRATYFDVLNTSEVLTFEAGVNLRDGKEQIPGTYRSALGDPFDFTKRVTSLGIVTLTIRKSEQFHTFFMHRRDPTNYPVASGQFHVVPAGEFAPSDVSPTAFREDLDLWRNMLREYAEEFLGEPDSQGKHGRTIDFETEEPYCSIQRARDSGLVHCYVLGFGLEPASWKPELLTVCVWEHDAFDEIFGSMVSSTDEGVLVVGKDNRGIPWDEPHVLDYTDHKNLRGSGKAALKLAWRHRHELGL